MKLAFIIVLTLAPLSLLAFVFVQQWNMERKIRRNQRDRLRRFEELKRKAMVK